VKRLLLPGWDWSCFAASDRAAAVKSWKCSGVGVWAKRVVSERVRLAAAARGAERKKRRRE